MVQRPKTIGLRRRNSHVPNVAMRKNVRPFAMDEMGAFGFTNLVWKPAVIHSNPQTSPT